MLHKSFKPAKCKTSLKMASSRTKLLKNKKEVQVKHLRRELAQLLESGQEQTAIIRVEHVVREEKMMTAYELVEIFCELIHARMQIIESQKNCPIDLREAVASVLFASPRCSDIPELVEVRKHFTAKYGKDFVSAAVELRPECGVNRNLVEKLSAKAPDGRTKLKILTAIAEEHNIKWDPKSFGEKVTDHQEDLLNGPNSLQNSSQTHLQPSNVQSSYYDSGPSNVQISPQNEVKQEPSVNVQVSNRTMSYAPQDVAPVQANAYANPHPDLKSPGAEVQGMGQSHGYSAALGRQNWNMEFKDATSAAQAAAESAEMASIAARAAAELSSMGRITTQTSSQSQGYSAHLSTHELPRRRPTSSFDGSNEASFQDSRSQGSSAHHSTHEFPRRHPSSSFDGSSEVSFKDSRPSTYHESQGSSHHPTHESPRRHYDPNSSHHPTQVSFKDSRPSTLGSHDEVSFNPVTASYQTQVSTIASTNSAFHESSITIDDDEPEDLTTLMRRVAGNVNSSRPSKSNSDSFAKAPPPERSEPPPPQPEAAHKNAQPNSFDDSSAVRRSRKVEGKSSDEVKDSVIFENVDELEDTRFGEAVEQVSSYAHSSVTLKSNSQRSSGENPFADFKGGEGFHEDHKPKNDTADVLFDDYDEGESYGLDLDKGLESDIYPPSPHRSSPSYLSPISKWSPPRSEVDPSPFSSVFVETSDDSTVQPQLDELPPIVFDDVSGPHSESEEEPEKTKPQHVLSPPSRNSSFGLTRNDSNTSDKSIGRRNQPLHSSKMPLFDERNDRSTEISQPDESSVDVDDAFYLGILPGGRRNKTSRLPPYTRSPSGESSSAKVVAAAAYGREADIEVEKSSGNRYSPSSKVTFDGESDSEDERTEITKSPIPRTIDTYRSSNSRSSLDRPMGSRASVASLDSDPENDPSPQVAIAKPRFSGLSRRTKGSPPSNTVRTSNFKSFGSQDADDSPPKTSSFSNRSSDSKSKFAYDDEATRVPINSNSSFQSSSSSPRRSSNLNSSFASEAAEEKQEHRVDAWRISNVKSRFVSEEAEIKELSPEVKPSRRTSNPNRHSKYMESQERRSYTEENSSSKFTNASVDQERREDRKPSSSRVSYPTETSVNVQPGTEFSDSRRVYDSRSSQRSDKTSKLNLNSGSKAAGRSQEHQSDNKSSSRSSSYVTKTSFDVKVPDDRVSSDPVRAGKTGSEKSNSKSPSSIPKDSLETSSMSLNPSKEDSLTNKASHVHPKLPDCDSFAAHFEALRANRR